MLLLLSLSSSAFVNIYLAFSCSHFESIGLVVLGRGVLSLLSSSLSWYFGEFLAVCSFRDLLTRFTAVVVWTGTTCDSAIDFWSS